VTTIGKGFLEKSYTHISLSLIKLMVFTLNIGNVFIPIIHNMRVYQVCFHETVHARNNGLNAPKISLMSVSAKTHAISSIFSITLVILQEIQYLKEHILLSFAEYRGSSRGDFLVCWKFISRFVKDSKFKDIATSKFIISTKSVHEYHRYEPSYSAILSIASNKKKFCKRINIHFY